MRDKEIEKIILLFENRTLLIDEWTHQKHIIAAVWYLMNYPKEKAYSIFRTNIIEYNNSVGTPNSSMRGYHETITWFWLSEIEKLIHERKYGTVSQACENILKSELSNSQYILNYYSREFLFSTEARKNILMPDLNPL